MFSVYNVPLAIELLYSHRLNHSAIRFGLNWHSRFVQLKLLNKFFFGRSENMR